MQRIVGEQINVSRIPSADGTYVTYDLTSITDFSTPEELGVALSEIFFGNDGVNWFSIDGRTVQFNAPYRVKIMFPSIKSKESRSVMSYFYYNLEKKIIPRKFAEQLRGSFEAMFGLAGRTRESLYSAQLKNSVMDYIDVAYV